MVRQLESGSGIKRFRGLSTDPKPKVGTILEDSHLLEEGPAEVTIKVGSVFTEVDTGARYIWNGLAWVRQEQTLEAILEDISSQMGEMIELLKHIQAATAAQANGAFGAAIPTGR
tara:strand:+ start:121 stop:465 length:345 start_codon:yes stop_codon:yes gene_type:complete